MFQKYTAQEWLEKYYHFVLLNTDIGKSAKDYLISRGMTIETIKKFKLGFSPQNVKPTLKFLKSKGFSFNKLVEDKILIRYESGINNGQLSDPFKNRIIFPIHNDLGKTVGFGGRSLNPKKKIKYINSPESSVFIKRHNIYGLNITKENIINEGYAILFEGYFDTLTAYQSGIQNSVSTLGTALTIEQALLLKEITDNVVIAFDGDKAGKKASFKSASVLKQVGCNVQIASFPNECDPDDYIKKYGGDTFVKKVILKAKPIVQSFVTLKKDEYNLSSPDGRFMYAHDVFDALTTNKSIKEKDVLKELKNTLNISTKSIYKYIN